MRLLLRTSPSCLRDLVLAHRLARMYWTSWEWSLPMVGPGTWTAPRVWHEDKMGQYCDTKHLERNWFNWLLASAVPSLEPFRQTGLLWTRIPGWENQELANPMSPRRDHCVAFATPYHISSTDGVLEDNGVFYGDGHVQRHPLPLELLDPSHDHPLHRLDQPFRQQGIVVPELKRLGFKLEVPALESWHAMLLDVDKTCCGIAKKFHTNTEDERSELAHEAFLQVVRKLDRKKLIYTPGRAPVFNLLTTTIYRCIYSILNRGSRNKKNRQKLATDLRTGVAPRHFRTLRVPGQPTIRSHP